MLRLPTFFPFPRRLRYLLVRLPAPTKSEPNPSWLRARQNLHQMGYHCASFAQLLFAYVCALEYAESLNINQLRHHHTLTSCQHTLDKGSRAVCKLLFCSGIVIELCRFPFELLLTDRFCAESCRAMCILSILVPFAQDRSHLHVKQRRFASRFLAPRCYSHSMTSLEKRGWNHHLKG